MKPTTARLMIFLVACTATPAAEASPNVANLKQIQPSVANRDVMRSLRHAKQPDAEAVEAGMVAQLAPLLTCYKDAAKTSASTANMLRAPSKTFESLRLVVAPGGTVSEVEVTSDVINGDVSACVTSLMARSTFATTNTESLTVNVPLPRM